MVTQDHKQAIPNRRSQSDERTNMQSTQGFLESDGSLADASPLGATEFDDAAEPPRS
jgi:hypothetical protein